MKILIVQLSDIHFKSDSNIVLERKEQICKAFHNLAKEIENIFIIFTGDIAFSGQESEYNKAIELVDFIKKKIEEYSQHDVNTIIIPGNHDCDFKEEQNKIRNTLIQNITISGESAIDNAIIDQCCMVQKNIFDFIDLYIDRKKVVFDNKLFKILSYNIESITINFNCYNSSWISQEKEQVGKLYFPIKIFSQIFSEYKSDLNISLLHHTPYWFAPSNRKEFQSHLEKTSDIVFTGHEHEYSASVKDDLKNHFTECIEGSILQDQENESISEFNVVMLDIKEKKHKIFNFKWDREKYTSGLEKIDWVSFRRHKREFELNEKYEEFILDAGAKFSHPNKEDLYLKDIFIFPNLMDLKIGKSDDSLGKIIDSKVLLEINETKNKIIIFGADKIGKTSLCKILFYRYHNNGYIPIYISGINIKSSSLSLFKKLMEDCYCKQYTEESLERFSQLENNKKVLIIDDFDKSRLNIKYKSILIDRIISLYPNIILTANDLFKIQDMVSDKDKEGSFFKKFQEYGILEFGHKLRNELINKWNLIGREEYISGVDLAHKNNQATHIINLILGKNLVPSYPVFLLTILQTIETGYSHNLQESAYGHYYQYLITYALQKINLQTEIIDSYYNYIIELANHFYSNKTREISRDKLAKFHKWYCETYKISPAFNEIYELNNLTKNLIKAYIIEDYYGVLRFKYKYIYYFFVAKYIANNISEKDIRKNVVYMCKRLFNEEFANIIMFLTFHSKDPIVLKEILNNAKSLFSEQHPAKLEKDISALNTLVYEVPGLVLESRDTDEHLNEIYKDQDELELSDKEYFSNKKEEEYDEKEEIEEIDFVTKLNQAFKIIEIMGQILRNYIASLKGDKKYELGEETYFLGLRILSIAFSVFEKDPDFFVGEIRRIIKERNISDTNKIEQLSKRFLFELFSYISLASIKKISISIGNEKLSETFKDILEKNNYPSIRLVDLSIKLDFFRGFPFNEIIGLKKDLQRNNLAYHVLRSLVVIYLYMFPMNYQDKQKICNLLNVSIKDMRVIDLKSSNSKRQKNPK